MVDVVSLVFAITAIVLSILSHVRHGKSKCLGCELDIETIESIDPPMSVSPITTPKESSTRSRAASNAIDIIEKI